MPLVALHAVPTFPTINIAIIRVYGRRELWTTM
jgi:hypothetical protein